jgi:voltage-gated potassium channel
MTQVQTSAKSQHGNAYNIFILVLTVISLIIMVLMVLPFSDATIGLLRFYDNLICVIFLVDFFINLLGASKKSDYFIKERGWLDLIGSIPAFGLEFRFTGLLRLARLSRLARIMRLLRGDSKKELVADVVRNRSQYAMFITILLTIIVLTTASVLELQFEGQSPNANITSGRDALWYSIVTITTVGYGDRYPVTPGGRITAVFIMFTGVAIIGALASILSSVLVGSPPAPHEEAIPQTVPAPAIEQELVAIKSELAALRQLFETMAPAKQE